MGQYFCVSSGNWKKYGGYWIGVTKLYFISLLHFSHFYGKKKVQGDGLASASYSNFATVIEGKKLDTYNVAVLVTH